MSPIERVSARGRALITLGLSSHATLTDIRKAYRRLARERHPDLNAGNKDDFASINAAYDYLRKNAKELGIAERHPAASPSVSRPTIKVTEVALNDDAVSACKKMFSGSKSRKVSRHIPITIRRSGRNLTYVVSTPVNNGNNLVALPTGTLVDNRRVMPQLVTIQASEICDGDYRVPANVCANLFPGAKSVRIRFAA